MPENKILHISHVDFGGAGIAAYHVHSILEKRVGRSVFVSKRKSKAGGVIVPGLLKKIGLILSKIAIKFLQSGFRKRTFAQGDKYCFYGVYETHSTCHVSARDILKSIDFVPDIIIVHWVTGFVNARTLYDLHRLTSAKFYWFLMDEAPLGAGCHYSWNCEGFKQSCSDCPAVAPVDKKRIADTYAYKERYLRDIDFSLICFSEYDYLKCLTSSLFKNKAVHKLLLPVDSSLYKPSQKDKSGDRVFKVLFGAQFLWDERKGLKFMLKAIQELSELFRTNNNDVSQIEFLIVGNTDESLYRDFKFKYQMLGMISPADLAEKYQESDLFISSSMEDSGPVMINQAMMSGLPVVAFNVGVAMDLIEDGVTGYKVERGDFRAMAERIYELSKLSEERLGMMKNNSRKKAEILLSEDAFVSNILKIIVDEN